MSQQRNWPSYNHLTAIVQPSHLGQAGVDAHGNVAGQLVGQLGWHMWSQALIDGHWHDLDATLQLPYTVGHVLVSPNNLAQP